MSLAFGRDHLSIPGPSVIPERVLNAMHQPSPNIYEGKLIELANGLYPDLNALARNDGDAVIYTGNGHAAWEASLTNSLSRGDTILALITGRFARGWVDMAKALGVNVIELDFGPDRPVDMSTLEEALRADTDRAIKAVLTVQTDTASTVTNNIAGIREVLNSVGHPALFMVDCIASLGCEPFEMTAWDVDVMLAASQKGLMTPPGLAFTFVRGKAWDAHRNADLKTPYWNWESRINGKVFHQKFCGTPPTHHLFALREALDMLNEEGLANIWRRHEVLASCVWAAAAVWGQAGSVSCHVANTMHRSRAVTALKCGKGDAPKIRNWCQHEAGVTLGIGLDLESVVGGHSDSLFRIGHMGHLNPPMILGTLGTLDASLKALGIAHGAGALEAATNVLARACAPNPTRLVC